MTDYIRLKSELHADWAYHIGMLLSQYERFCKENKLSNTDTFEVTLLISLFQSLLTSFLESRQIDADYTRSVNSQSLLEWGIEPAMILQDSFTKKGSLLTISDLFEHIRHSLSHPLGTDNEVLKPFTGFSTQRNDNHTDLIDSVTFKHSPDIRTPDDQLKSNTKVFVVRLPVSTLRTIVIRLSNALSMPLTQEGVGKISIAEHFSLPHNCLPIKEI